MASFAGLSLRTVGERAYDRRSAAAELADIEKGEGELRDFLAGWTRRYAGDAAALRIVDDLLSDYFYRRRRDAEGEVT